MAGQRALAGHDWPQGGTVRVRMGLHSGEAARHEDGYVGMDVHRAARIAAAAHGGQVVVSEATRLLAASRLPAGVLVEDPVWSVRLAKEVSPAFGTACHHERW